MKKKGSALILSLLVLAIISMLLLSTNKVVTTKNREAEDTLKISLEDNIRDNGLTITKHEIKKVEKILKEGIIFKSSSPYFDRDYKYPTIKKSEYFNVDVKGNKIINPLKHYTGIEPKSFFEYVNGYLDPSVSPMDQPWIASDEIDSNGELVERKWQKPKENLLSLLSAPHGTVSIGGYKFVSSSIVPGNNTGGMMPGKLLEAEYMKKIEIDKDIYEIKITFKGEMAAGKNHSMEMVNAKNEGIVIKKL